MICVGGPFNVQPKPCFAICRVSVCKSFDTAKLRSSPLVAYAVPRSLSACDQDRAETVVRKLHHEPSSIYKMMFLQQNQCLSQVASGKGFEHGSLHVSITARSQQLDRLRPSSWLSGRGEKTLQSALLPAARSKSLSRVSRYHMVVATMDFRIVGIDA